MTGPDTDMQTLLVGIDAGCFNVLTPFFEEGALPTLRELFDRGASGTLGSQIPPWTASAWPSIYTGVNPGKHGVFGFLTFDGYGWDVVNATSVRESTLWELLDSRGYTSVVVNGPVTHPPPEIDGAVVPGYVGPDRPECHPEGLLEGLLGDIADGSEGYRVYPSDEAANASAQRLIEEFVALIRMRGEAFVSLCERFDPDFGFLQFQQTDTVLHEFPGKRDRIRPVYEALDRQLETVLAACDAETVVVVSDHGMEAYDGRFRVNDFLANHGYVESVKGGEGMPTWAKIRDSGTRANEGLVPKAMERAANVGITAQRVGHILELVGLRDRVAELVPVDAIRAGSEQVDFADSTAYMRSRVETGVRINLAGREPAGTVPRADYDRVRRDLISLLESARTPAGHRVFEDVAPREEYFHGPYVEEAVDVVTVPTDFNYYVTTWLLGEEFATPDEPDWDHTLEGVIAVAGDSVDGTASLADADLFDVAPTVLASLSLPVSDRMDGSPLPVVAPTPAESYPRPTDGQETTERPAVRERLSNMGYLE